MHYLFLAIQAIAAAALLYSCFYRLVRTSTETILSIRIAVLAQAAASMLALTGPYLPRLDPEAFNWMYLTTPGWIWLSVLAVQAYIQIVASRHWVNAVPDAFLRSEFRINTDSTGAYVKNMPL